MKKTSPILFNPEMVLGEIQDYQNIQVICPTTLLSMPIADTIFDCTSQSA